MEYQKASSRHKALSLVDMSSAFVVLGLGVSLSILVFLIELIYKRINDHYIQLKYNNTALPYPLIPEPYKEDKQQDKIKIAAITEEGEAVDETPNNQPLEMSDCEEIDDISNDS